MCYPIYPPCHIQSQAFTHIWKNNTTSTKKNSSTYSINVHTYNHVLQSMLGQPAVEKYGDKEVPQGRPEDLKTDMRACLGDVHQVINVLIYFHL